MEKHRSRDKPAATTGAGLRAAPVVARMALAAALLLGALLAVGGLTVGASGKATSVTVSPPVPVTAMNRLVEPANNSPKLLADPTDARFVIMANRLDAPDYGCALQVSGDGGRGWRTADPVPTLPAGAEKCYAPEAGFDRNGLLYYLFVGLAGSGNGPMGAFLTTSRDRGTSFSAPRQILGPHNFSVRMAVDADHGRNGRIHLVWLHATTPPSLGSFGPPPNPILAAHSDDGGKTFSKPVQVSDPSRPRAVAPALALGPDQRVHVAYYDLGRDAVDYQGLEGPVWEGKWSIVMSTSTDGGSTFARGTALDTSIVPPGRVMLIFTMPPPALTAGAGRLCVGWTDSRRGDPDVLVRCSSNGGRAWEPPRRANDDPVRNGAHQSLPGLSLAPDGRLDVVFYDRRDDRENLATLVYYTFSRDGGRNFAPNVKLTRDIMDPTIGQRYAVRSALGQVEFGSRMGLLSRRADVLAAWTDTHNSKAPTTSQDIFAARVAVPPVTRESPGPRLAGAVSIVAVAVIVVARKRRRARAAA